jgi:hypothetical protein
MFSLVILLRAYNRQNNLVQVILSLYMYTAGLQRQAFSVLSHLGLLISYSMLVSGMGLTASGRRQTHKKAKSGSAQQTAVARFKKVAVGPLKNLSIECMKAVRNVVKQRIPIGIIFDNINMTYGVSEQVLGRTGMLILFVYAIVG